MTLASPPSGLLTMAVGRRTAALGRFAGGGSAVVIGAGTMRTLLLILAMVLLAAAPVMAADTPIEAAPGNAAPNDPAAGSPRASIVKFYDALLEVMKTAKQLGFGGRAERLAPVIDATFDMREMTRLTLGSAGKSLTAEQFDQLVESFRRYTVASYADNFDDYNGERFVVGEARQAAGGQTVVPSKLVFAGNNPPVSLDYVMRQSEGRWGITDIFAEGSVSQVAMRRSEFVSLLRREGYDTLLKTIETKTAALATKG